MKLQIVFNGIKIIVLLGSAGVTGALSLEGKYFPDKGRGWREFKAAGNLHP